VIATLELSLGLPGLAVELLLESEVAKVRAQLPDGHDDVRPGHDAVHAQVVVGPLGGVVQEAHLLEYGRLAGLAGAQQEHLDLALVLRPRALQLGVDAAARGGGPRLRLPPPSPPGVAVAGRRRAGGGTAAPTAGGGRGLLGRRAAATHDRIIIVSVRPRGVRPQWVLFLLIVVDVIIYWSDWVGKDLLFIAVVAVVVVFVVGGGGGGRKSCRRRRWGNL